MKMIRSWMQGSAARVAARVSNKGLKSGININWKRDFEGEPWSKNVVRIACENMDAGMLSSKELQPSRGNEVMWNWKHKDLCLLQKEMELDVGGVSQST